MFSLKDKSLAKDIVSKIKKLDINLKFMHVCGTHQDSLVKHGLDALLKKCGVKIGQGPGCPVCVTTPREIEEMLILAKKGKIVTSFGDMINVPGETESLRSMRSEGCDVRTVYGIEDAVEIWGLTSQKSQEWIVTRHGKNTRTACVGPAAEKLVRYAAIVSGRRTASRCGTGTVMASKNLKAIAINAVRNINIHDPERMKALTGRQIEILRSARGFEGFRQNRRRCRHGYNPDEETCLHGRSRGFESCSICYT